MSSICTGRIGSAGTVDRNCGSEQLYAVCLLELWTGTVGWNCGLELWTGAAIYDLPAGTVDRNCGPELWTGAPIPDLSAWLELPHHMAASRQFLHGCPEHQKQVFCLEQKVHMGFCGDPAMGITSCYSTGLSWWKEPCTRSDPEGKLLQHSPAPSEGRAVECLLFREKSQITCIHVLKLPQSLSRQKLFTLPIKPHTFISSQDFPSGCIPLCFPSHAQSWGSYP